MTSEIAVFIILQFLPQWYVNTSYGSCTSREVEKGNLHALRGKLQNKQLLSERFTKLKPVFKIYIILGQSPEYFQEYSVCDIDQEPYVLILDPFPRNYLYDVSQNHAILTSPNSLLHEVTDSTWCFQIVKLFITCMIPDDGISCPNK